MTYTLTLSQRTSTKPDLIREAGDIPAVVYGPSMASASVAINAREFDRLYKEAGSSSLIDVVVPGEKNGIKVLVQDVQYDVVTRNHIHIDFRAIDMTKEMHVDVDLRYIGEAPAVKALGGTMVKIAESVSVKCLPQNLVSHIDVDLSSLVTFEDMIHISELVLPAGIVVTDDAFAVVAKVVPPLTEDQLKKLEEAGSTPVDLTKIAIEEKGKKEEEEGAEGEAVVAEGEKKVEKKEEKKEKSA